MRGADSGIRFSPASAGNTGHRSGSGQAIAVQPRERGEHMSNWVRKRLTCGSAPRARGTHARIEHALAQRRFSPASAGNTSSGRHRQQRHTVQPRERGEHVAVRGKQNYVLGSAPRARGTQVGVSPTGAAPRFSPASAGNTNPVAEFIYSRPVQPRERGEHASPYCLKDPEFGSAPRARGTLLVAAKKKISERFSPASAGNTQPSWHEHRYCAVQPRERGEHAGKFTIYRNTDGSAPRARGTRLWDVRNTEGDRFSPASAGNTHTSPSCASHRPVQPRERGEHRSSRYRPDHDRGSAPRARGTPGRRHGRAASSRFSPASAGNTKMPRARYWERPVQPRERGEHAKQNSR